MWPFLKEAHASKSSAPQGSEAARRKPMRSEDLVADMGDFSDLAKHDVALKFWLPEPVSFALMEMGDLGGESISEMLRRFQVSPSSIEVAT